MAEGRRKRVRERIRDEGVSHFAAHEVLEYMLYPFVPRKDTNPIGHALLNRFGSLKKVFEATEEELKKVPGVTKSAAEYIANYLKLYPIVTAGKGKVEYIRDIREAKRAAERGLKNAEYGVTVIYSLDVKKRIVNKDVLGKGMDMKSVAETVILRKAVYALLASKKETSILTNNEHETIRRLRAALSNINVSLEDYITVTDEGAESYRQKIRDNNIFSRAVLSDNYRYSEDEK